MNSRKIVSAGAFNSYGINDTKTITTSKLLINKQQQERIKERNEIAKRKHIQQTKSKINENNEIKRSHSCNNSKKSLNLNDKEQQEEQQQEEENNSLTGQTKIRIMKQKELAIKLEYLKKLQTKEDENAVILSISKTLLKHNQSTLHQERRKALDVLSKIETVIRFETEQQEQHQQEKQEPPSQRASLSSINSQTPKVKSQSTPSKQINQNNNIDNNVISFEREKINSTNLNQRESNTKNFQEEEKKSSSFVPINDTNRVKLPIATNLNSQVRKNSNDFNQLSINIPPMTNVTNATKLNKNMEFKEPVIPIIPIIPNHIVNEKSQLKSINISQNIKEPPLIDLIPVPETRSGNNIPFSNQPSLEEIDINLVDILENEDEDYDYESKKQQISPLPHQQAQQQQQQQQKQFQEEKENIVKIEDIEVKQNKPSSIIPTTPSQKQELVQLTQQNSSAVKLSKIWGMGGNQNDDEVSESEWDD